MAKFLRCLLLLLLLQNIRTGRGSSATDGVTKLKVGVPKKHGFTQFVNVENKYKVTGYCIDVFDAVVKLLPFNVSVEYAPYVNGTGQSAGSYDSLLQQIPNKQVDAVVGDVTIVANRSNYVDFTLPYAESDVKMLVKVRHDPRLNMWVFLRPFSWDLWLSIAIVCILIGGTIRFMERNVKKDAELENSTRREHYFTGVSILWLPVVQAVFPKRESLAKNCSRFVLVMWLILAYVLMQSYTASLSSILTIHQLQPRYPSENDVVRDPKINVGYQRGSFVRDVLVDRLKFNESRLKKYTTIEEYWDALDKGSQKGGVDAIFDEVWFIKIFLKEYGSDYVMVGTRHRTDGFGFAFPKGSNLTEHFSRAVLNVSQSEDMDLIEKKYFRSSDDELQGQSNSSSASPSLTAYSFTGLFVVIGILSLLALLVSESRIWRKPIMLAKTYSQKFLTRSSTRTSSQSGDGSSSTTRANIEGFTIRRNIGSADGGDNHPRVPTRSLSCTDFETLPV